VAGADPWSGPHEGTVRQSALPQKPRLGLESFPDLRSFSLKNERFKNLKNSFAFVFIWFNIQPNG
jgi:hypothetical protein